MFPSTFAPIFWIKFYKKNTMGTNNNGFMSGLTTSNEFIARDEANHVLFACLLFSMLEDKPTKDKVYEIIKNGIVLIKEFMTIAIPCNLIGMNIGDMSNYIEYITDHLLVNLNYPKLFHTANPFVFMNNISLINKSNF